LLGPGDEVQSLDATSVPLGIVPENVPSARPRTLRSGEIVLFLTDGIPEIISPQGVAFGNERAFDVVRRNRHLPAGEIVKALYQSARSFAQDTPQKDDITAVVLKVETPPG
jgi:sigma-B regulation protein RsbU (phosphoserine phosphatase)